MTEIDQVRTLLQSTKTIIAHNEELKKLRGENFNVFSILGLESNENRTHSAFLGELLNPKGSHNLGSTFLKCFLESIGYTGALKTDSATLELEKHIGRSNYEDKTGGRIDIFIKDDANNTIAIENKIYAADQFAQIERYVRFKDIQHVVFYLTLHGNDASEESRGNLKNGQDYLCISYRTEIIEWLEACVKEAAHYPILRETIKQYQILIKNLTNTMSDAYEKELLRVIFDNYEAAQIVSEKMIATKNGIAESIREGVLKVLQENLSDKFSVKKGSSISSRFAQIWITPKGGSNKLYFGVESFSGDGHLGGDLFVGLANESKMLMSSFEVDPGFSSFWVSSKKISPIDGIQVNFSNSTLLRTLFKNPDSQNSLIQHIAIEVIDYIRRHQAMLN